MVTDTNSGGSPDVIVIGGGLIGCATAFRLAHSGLRVMVLDRSEPGGEASRAAAGMLAPQGEMIEANEFFELCAASRDLYHDFVAEIEELTGQQVGYRSDGNLFVAIEDEGCRKLDDTYRSQTRMGLKLERLSSREVLKRVPGLSPKVGCGVLIPGDHWVDNERLARALVDACRRLGVTFHTGSPVTKLKVRNGRVENIETGPNPHGAPSTYSADKFVLAAGSWSPDLVAPIGIELSMEPCRGQMIEFESASDLPLVVRGGHYYLVPRPGKRILAGTTVEYVGFDKAVTGEGLRSILDGTLRFAPVVKDFRFLRAWAGLRPDTVDHLPILGYGELKNLIFATGHFRNGILLAPVTAHLISQLLLTGTCSRPIEAYSPMRFQRGKTAQEE